MDFRTLDRQVKYLLGKNIFTNFCPLFEFCVTTYRF